MDNQNHSWWQLRAQVDPRWCYSRGKEQPALCPLTLCLFEKKKNTNLKVRIKRPFEKKVISFVLKQCMWPMPTVSSINARPLKTCINNAPINMPPPPPPPHTSLFLCQRERAARPQTEPTHLLPCPTSEVTHMN